MILQHPFTISPRLLPALRIGGGWLHLKGIVPGEERRQRAVFIIEDTAAGLEYTDDAMQSGCGGFISRVAAFEGFLSFLMAAVESRQYRESTGREGENESLFPAHVVDWAVDNYNKIEATWTDILMPEDPDYPVNHALISG